MQVSWLDRWNFLSLKSWRPDLEYWTTMRSPSSSTTLPFSAAMIMSAASRAARASMPVPM